MKKARVVFSLFFILIFVFTFFIRVDATEVPITTQTIFQASNGNYPRLPGILCTKDGTLLATTQWRKGSTADYGYPADIILRRSTDGGATWGAVQTIFDGGENITVSIGPIVQDNTTGRIFLTAFYIPTDGHGGEGTYFQTCALNWTPFYVSWSDDDGITWSAPTAISVQTNSNGDYALPTNAVHGLFLSSERIVIPAWVLPKENDTYLSQRAGIIYSDDHGITWKVGAIAPANSNESSVALDGNGDIYMSWRTADYTLSDDTRGWSRSVDDGLTFGNSGYQSELVNSMVHAGLSSFADSSGRTILVFSNPKGPNRTNMNIRISEDNGYTWSNGVRINTSYAGYSDIAVVGDKVCCIYEADTFNRMDCALIDIDALYSTGVYEEIAYYDGSEVPSADQGWNFEEGNLSEVSVENGKLEINKQSSGRVFWTKQISTSPTTSYTCVEIRARIDAVSSVPLELSVYTDAGNAYAVNIFKDKMTYWNGTSTDTIIADAQDNYSAYHTYSLVISPNNTLSERKVSIYRDGVLLSEQAPCTASNLNNTIKFGKAWGSPSLVAEVDYLRYSTTGTYEPMFGMDGDDVPSVENAGWTFTGTGGVSESQASSAQDGILMLSANGNRAYWTAPFLFDTYLPGVSIEMRAKLENDNTAPIEMVLDSGEDYLYAVNIWQDKITYWNGTTDVVLASNLDNYSDFHVFEVRINEGLPRSISVYRDGVLISQQNGCAATSGRAEVKWGKGWQNHELNAQIDYLRVYCITRN